jgi:hypothetical protein
MNIIKTWEGFKDHKRMQTVYEGSAFNLTGESVVQNFIHSSRDAISILHRYNHKHHNLANTFKWLPDQLASTIQEFFTEGSCQIYCLNNGVVVGCHPTLPASTPRTAVPRVRGRNTNARSAPRGQKATPGNKLCANGVKKVMGDRNGCYKAFRDSELKQCQWMLLSMLELSSAA